MVFDLIADVDPRATAETIWRLLEDDERLELARVIRRELPERNRQLIEERQHQLDEVRDG